VHDLVEVVGSAPVPGVHFARQVEVAHSSEFLAGQRAGEIAKEPAAGRSFEPRRTLGRVVERVHDADPMWRTPTGGCGTLDPWRLTSRIGCGGCTTPTCDSG